MTITGKDVKDFIKKLYDVNQLMKSIYKDEPNFFPVYILNHGMALYADEDCIPEIIQYNFKEPFKGEFYVTVDSGDFFKVFKESSVKNSITKIDINENSIVFYANNCSIFSLKKNEKLFSKILDKEQEYMGNVRHYDGDEYMCEFNFPEEIINNIVNVDTKKLVHLILDVDNENIYIKDKVNLDEIESYLEFFITKKFINGISYKIKELKKGPVKEYTPIKIYLNEAMGGNYFDIDLVVFLKNNDTIEHHFMICDF